MWGYLLLTLVGFIVGILFYRKFFGTQKTTYTQDPKNGILYMIDKLDHLFSVSDLISPSADAFDKPFELCDYIDKIPKDKHIKLIICTKGGTLSSLEKILKRLMKHSAGYTTYIKYECFSAGAMLALGAKEIVMSDNSYLGKIDPQISNLTDAYPAIIYHKLDPRYITGDNIDKVIISEYVLNYLNELLNMIFVDKKHIKEKVEEQMVFSHVPHNKTFDFEACQQMGLPVRKPTQEEMMLLK
jgi:hypothetical protein